MRKTLILAALAIAAFGANAQTYDSGLIAVQAASLALANTGATPTRTCNNKRADRDATIVLMEGQTAAGTVALEVVKQGDSWRIRDAKNPESWPASTCKYYSAPFPAP